MGNVLPPSPPSPSQPTQHQPGLTQPSPPDPISNRPHNHHRPLENTRLLRAEAEIQRHRCVLHGPLLDPNALAVHRVLRRAVWHLHPVWRLLRDDCGLCEEYPGGWAVDWGAG